MNQIWSQLLNCLPKYPAEKSDLALPHIESVSRDVPIRCSTIENQTMLEKDSVPRHGISTQCAFSQDKTAETASGELMPLYMTPVSNEVLMYIMDHPHSCTCLGLD